MNAGYLRELCDYWKEGYNWRREEQKLNQLTHYRTEIDDIGIHFVYDRGKGPAAFPLTLTRGYPDSFLSIHEVDPASYNILDLTPRGPAEIGTRSLVTDRLSRISG